MFRFINRDSDIAIIRPCHEFEFRRLSVKYSDKFGPLIKLFIDGQQSLAGDLLPERQAYGRINAPRDWKKMRNKCDIQFPSRDSFQNAFNFRCMLLLSNPV